MTPAALIVALVALNLLCGAAGIGLGVFLVKRRYRREETALARSTREYPPTAAWAYRNGRLLGLRSRHGDTEG